MIVGHFFVQFRQKSVGKFDNFLKTHLDSLQGKMPSYEALNRA